MGERPLYLRPVPPPSTTNVLFDLPAQELHSGDFARISILEVHGKPVVHVVFDDSGGTDPPVVEFTLSEWADFVARTNAALTLAGTVTG